MKENEFVARYLLVLTALMLAACGSEDRASVADNVLKEIRDYQAEQQRYFGQHGRYGELKELHLHEATFQAFQNGLDGYRFTAEGGKTGYKVTARPEVAGVSFYADETGAVHRSADAKVADASSPLVQ